jgi:hypothetical protein
MNNAAVTRRFNELAEQAGKVPILRHNDGMEYVPIEELQQWATSALSLLRAVFGEDSPQFQNLQRAYDKSGGWPNDLKSLKGVFAAAKSDFEGGYLFSLKSQISGELLGDFVSMAKLALAEGHKDVAAVLACAALEDTLKKFAALNGLECGDKDMSEVVSALKTKGLVSGAQKSLLDSMPKVRNYAMHANWDKIQPADVNSVIGYVEQFLLSHFAGG